MGDVPTTLRSKLGLRDTLRILIPYLRRHFLNQVSGIWFIVVYLILFQLFVLQLPIVYAAMIGVGIGIVAVGLMFFMEGLRLGLMPLGEVIGSVLPKGSPMPAILAFAFLLGIGATFAEPAIAVLKAAGSGVLPEQAPLLYSLLNDFSAELVAAVGVGVGVAVMLGVLRFFYAWPLKYLAVPIIGLLLALSVYFSQVSELAAILGLAWDCGAVTTGPVTVPLVLALGIGVCRVVSSGTGGGGHSGFGIVTLASLFPILAVLLLALFHYGMQDYYGTDAYQGEPARALAHESLPSQPEPQDATAVVSEEEYLAYIASGTMPEDYELEFSGGAPELVDGEIRISDPQVIIKKRPEPDFNLVADQTWDGSQPLLQSVWSASLEALRAIIPLCLFLYLVLRWGLGERLEQGADVAIGVGFAVFGMALFGLGIALGLTPLGVQLGSNVPLAFAEIVPWGTNDVHQPLFADDSGKLVAVIFALFLGYGATLAEPALNALGDTVERITVGAFRKQLLMQSVAFGVGLGIAAGVVKMAYNLPIIWMLLPAYCLVLGLTLISPNSFVNFAWDSAGVTTGPITVPLVLAMGLGIGANVVGVSDGFGILALASVGPILTVLSVGLYTQRVQWAQRDEERQELELSPELVEAIS